jgi:hypothetical protein
MKIKDVERVNHLIAELEEVRRMTSAAGAAETGDFQLFLEGPGDMSLKMSAEGASSTHFQGFAASAGFLEGLRKLALEELRAREAAIKAELASFGVEADE